jgi:hypothetical protein
VSDTSHSNTPSHLEPLLAQVRSATCDTSDVKWSELFECAHDLTLQSVRRHTRYREPKGFCAQIGRHINKFLMLLLASFVWLTATVAAGNSVNTLSGISLVLLYLSMPVSIFSLLLAAFGAIGREDYQYSRPEAEIVVPELFYYTVQVKPSQSAVGNQINVYKHKQIVSEDKKLKASKTLLIALQLPSDMPIQEVSDTAECIQDYLNERARVSNLERTRLLQEYGLQPEAREHTLQKLIEEQTLIHENTMLNEQAFRVLDEELAKKQKTTAEETAASS